MSRTISVKTFFLFLFLFLLPHGEETLGYRSKILVSLGQFFFTLFPNEWVVQAAPIINAQRGGLSRSILFNCRYSSLGQRLKNALWHVQCLGEGAGTGK